MTTDEKIIADERVEQLDFNQREATQGYYREVVIPAMLRRIDELELRDGSSTILPRRRCVLTLRLGADTRDSMIEELREIMRNLRTGNLSRNCTTGGHSAGYFLNVSEDESVTHESYFEAINRLTK